MDTAPPAATPEADRAALVEALGRGLPGGRLVNDPAVRARTEDEVRHVVRTCAEFRAPVVPRGAGTGLSGGANATEGCVVLDLSAMNQVLAIDADNLTCVGSRAWGTTT